MSALLSCASSRALARPQRFFDFPTAKIEKQKSEKKNELNRGNLSCFKLFFLSICSKKRLYMDTWHSSGAITNNQHKGESY
jgi:hypothetical protein